MSMCHLLPTVYEIVIRYITATYKLYNIFNMYVCMYVCNVCIYVCMYVCMYVMCV